MDAKYFTWKLRQQIYQAEVLHKSKYTNPIKLQLFTMVWIQQLNCCRRFLLFLIKLMFPFNTFNGYKLIKSALESAMHSTIWNYKLQYNCRPFQSQSHVMVKIRSHGCPNLRPSHHPLKGDIHCRLGHLLAFQIRETTVINLEVTLFLNKYSRQSSSRILLLTCIWSGLHLVTKEAKVVSCIRL